MGTLEAFGELFPKKPPKANFAVFQGGKKMTTQIDSTKKIVPNFGAFFQCTMIFPFCSHILDV